MLQIHQSPKFDDLILFTISLVPTFVLMSFDSSFPFLATNYCRNLGPYLVVLTLGKDKTHSWRLRLYLMSEN